MEPGIFVYPWDLADYGVGRALDMIASLGMRRIYLAATYHFAKLLSPHNPVRRVFFPQPDAAYVAVRENRYPDGSAPPVADIAEGSALATRILHEAHRRDIAVTAWTICLHNSTAGFARPDMACHNAYGEALHHSLCPANPEVQSYLSALLQDVQAAGFVDFSLESAGFMRFVHGYHHEMYAFPVFDELDFLLSLCFCRSCLARAAESLIDIDRLRESTQRRIEALIAGAVPRSLGEAVANTLGLSELVEVRKGAVQLLLDVARNALSKESTLSAIATPFPPATEAGMRHGLDPVAAARTLGTVATCGYYEGAERPADELRELCERGLDAARIDVILRPQYPDASSYANVAAKVAALRRLQPRRIAFYNFGQMPTESLAWVRRVTEEEFR